MRAVVHNLKKEIVLAIVVAVIGIAMLFAVEIMIAKGTAVNYNIEIWIDACSIIDFFFPLLVTLPFTWKLYFERKNGFLTYVSVRTDKRKYIIQKILSGVAAVFIMVFSIYYIGLIIAIFLVKPETVISDNILYKYIWGSIQAEKPLIFGIFWCVWKGFTGTVICVFGYGIALLADNIFVIALFPFLYCMLENFVTGTLKFEKYSICTAYILNRLSPKVMKVFNYCAGIISFIIVGSIIIFVWSYRKKRVEKGEEYN